MTPPVVTPPSRPSSSHTVVGLKAFVAAPTVSEKTSAAGAIIGAVFVLVGLALIGFVAYGIVLKGTQLSTVVTITFVAIGAALVVGGCYAAFPDKTKAFLAVLEGIGQDLHLPFMRSAT